MASAFPYGVAQRAEPCEFVGLIKGHTAPGLFVLSRMKAVKKAGGWFPIEAIDREAVHKALAEVGTTLETELEKMEAKQVLTVQQGKTIQCSTATDNLRHQLRLWEAYVKTTRGIRAPKANRVGLFELLIEIANEECLEDLGISGVQPRP